MNQIFGNSTRKAAGFCVKVKPRSTEESKRQTQIGKSVKLLEGISLERTEYGLVVDCENSKLIGYNRNTEVLRFIICPKTEKVEILIKFGSDQKEILTFDIETLYIDGDVIEDISSLDIEITFLRISDNEEYKFEESEYFDDEAGFWDPNKQKSENVEEILEESKDVDEEYINNFEKVYEKEVEDMIMHSH